MRVRLDCDRCGSVAMPPEEVTVLTHEGSPAEALFDCPVCTRVGSAPVTPVSLTVLLARGAAEIAESTCLTAPLGLADLRRLQMLLADDQTCQQLLGGTLEH